MGTFWHADPVEGSLGAMDKDLILLTGCTSLHILGDSMVYPWPGEVLLSLPNHFVPPGVACGGMVMNQGHEVLLLGLGYFVDSNGPREFLRWEYNYILVVLFPLVGSCGPKKDVWPCVGFPRYVMNDEIVFLQVYMPLGHPSIEILWGLPVLEVCMVSRNNEGKFSPSQVVLPVN
jgi:hypothetical protein